VQHDVDIERTHMRHVVSGKQQPRHRTADDSELAIETAEKLTDSSKADLTARVVRSS
jgi:hypothetical protein